VTGPVACGKSTFIQKFSGNGAFSINNENGRTVALDFGRCSVSGLKIFVFGTPGHEHFEFMREILAQGADGLLVLFDSTRPQTFRTAINMLQRLLKKLPDEVPFVLVANKQDLPEALDVEYFSLAAGDSFSIVGTSAITGEGIGKAIAILLRKKLQCVPAV
jgi:small GTP-binding protein